MKVLFHYTGAGYKVSNNHAYFYGIICFHIEFHRMATIIIYCELKKLKILKDDYSFNYML